MAENNNANVTVESLLKGMENYLTTKTVVGEPIQVKDMVILPLCNVSFGVGAGAWNGEKKNNGGGGMGGKINPTAMLIIQDGTARMVSVNEGEDMLSQILNKVPDVVNRLFNKSGEEIEDAAEEEADE